MNFIYNNLAIQSNVIDAAYRSGVKKLLFLGSSCIYPRNCPQPMKEEYLLTGPLEPTNEWYAIAKIAGIKMCQAYRRQFGFNAICLQPTNLYGPNDNFDLENSHVLPALIRKIYEATSLGKKEVTIWGTGKPRREFMHVDDFAEAALFLMLNYDAEEIINIGVGKDVSITELAELICKLIGFKGKIIFDSNKPDGMPRKLLDATRLRALGWESRISLERGIKMTLEWYSENLEKTRGINTGTR